jgi:hypothetical protein
MSTMRDLLLRVQRDAAFAHLVRVDLDAAAIGYSLTAEELESLRRLDQSLYRYLVPAHRVGERGAVVGSPPWEQPPPEQLPITIDLFEKLQIDVPFLDLEQIMELPIEDWSIAGKRMPLDDAERLALLDEIRTSSGQERRGKLEALLEYVR